MIKLANIIIAYIDAINNFIGKYISWLILLMVITTFGITFFRYVFNSGLIWIQEIVIYMHVIVFMLVIPQKILENSHVRIDIFYNKFSNRTKSFINLFGHIFFLIPMCVVIIIYGWNFVINSWLILEESPEAGGLPFIYLLKSIIIITPVLMILQAISQSIKELKNLICSA